MHQQQILMQQQLLGFMQHVVTAIGAPPPQALPQLGQPATTSMTLALQPSGLQSQGQPPAQYASPTKQVSQWFASPVVAPQFTLLQIGFTSAQTLSLLVPDTSVSRSLGATFSELTGHPTLPYLHVLGPSTVAPVTGTIETLPSSVASSELAATVIPAEPTAALVPDPTQTASASLPAIEG